MAGQARSKTRPRAKRPKLRYFFLNGKLHKKLRINRGADLLVAWNYPDSKKATYVYSDVIRMHEKAFTTAEVCEMVNRKIMTIENAWKNGMIEKPQHTYGLDENKNLYQYFWQEAEIMELLRYLSTVHKGRPRNDGEVTPVNLPTPRELRAMIHNEAVLYYKNDSGEFVPSWRAKEFK